MSKVCECGQPAVMFGVCGESLGILLVVSLVLNVIQLGLRLFNA